MTTSELGPRYEADPSMSRAERVLADARSILKERRGFSNTAHLECLYGHKLPTGILQKCPECPDDVFPASRLSVKYDFPEKLNPNELKARWEFRKLSQNPTDTSGVWRFRELSPFCDDAEKVVTLGEGNTRLLDAPTCAMYVGYDKEHCDNLKFKHQGDNPTRSFKDPGMTAGITYANMLDMVGIIVASTGNTSASAAAYARKAGMTPFVLVPKGEVSKAKLAQVLDYGAHVALVNGDFDKSMALVEEVAPKLGIMVVNSSNPFRMEGQKTIAPELLEQLNWEIPDVIVVPGGNLGNVSSLYKGLRELKELGFIDKLPRLVVVQVEGANPLFKAFAEKHPDELIPVKADTLLTAVRIGNPVRFKYAVEAIEETGGCVVEVSEQEAAWGKEEIGIAGIGCEPASALTLAGTKKLLEQGKITQEEKAVLVLTGDVLKDPNYSANFHAGELSFHDQLILPKRENKLTEISNEYEMKRWISTCTKNT
ncbi:MAG: threonine synthase [Candidatus Levyibacteriota bacterium]